MNDVFYALIRQTEAGRAHCLTGGAAADFPAGLHEVGSGREVHRAVHAFAAEEPGICGGDQGVDSFFYDVSVNQFDQSSGTVAGAFRPDNLGRHL